MSTYHGSVLTLSVFGQSHGPAVGAVLDGLPAGFRVDREALARFLQRRAPGRSALSTARAEPDEAEFLGGLADDTTCGAPLAVMIRNINQNPQDYDNLPLRPAHADFTAAQKYGGYEDRAGGGCFSGRLTAPLCAVGGVCLQMLEGRGIRVFAHAASVGEIDDARFDPLSPQPPAGSDLPVLDAECGNAMREAIAAVKAAGDSLGGTVECAVTGLPAGLGGPLFDGLEGSIARLLFGIPAVKGVEFGSGFGGSRLRGSENNDPFVLRDGAVVTASNNHGGILGGISSGMPLLLRAAFKPTPSISLPQRTVELSSMEETVLELHGRHDPCVVPRAVPCVEAAVAVAVLDALLAHQTDDFFFGGRT